MQEINESAEKFKTSPLGFLMSVIAKYQAHMQKKYEVSNDLDSLKKSKNAAEMLDNLKIELSKTDSLRKEVSDEAVLMHVIENCEKEEKETILECVFEYLNLVETAIQKIDEKSEEGKELYNEYYDISRLGLLLNCYLGEFDNDDFYYGTLADIAEVIKGSKSDDSKLPELCDFLMERIQKAPIDLTFSTFLADVYASVGSEKQKVIYDAMIIPYAESLLNKVLTQEVGDEDVGKLACSKQIQRMYEKLMLQ